MANSKDAAGDIYARSFRAWHEHQPRTGHGIDQQTTGEREDQTSYKRTVQATLEPEHYALLNLPRDCSQAQIKERYRHLSLTFHPDKLPTGKTSEAGQEAFMRIQNAAATVADPASRRIYDTLGQEGVEQAKRWPVALQTANIPPHLLRQIFKMNNKTKSSSYDQDDDDDVEDGGKGGRPVETDMTIHLHALQPGQSKGVPKMTMYQALLKNTFKVPLSSGYTLQATSTALSRPSTTQTGLALALQLNGHPTPTRSFEVGCSVLRPYYLTLKGTQSSEDGSQFCTIATGGMASALLSQQRMGSPSIPPVTMTVGQKVSEHSTAFMTYRTPTLGTVITQQPSSLTLGLTNDHQSTFLSEQIHTTAAGNQLRRKRTPAHYVNSSFLTLSAQDVALQSEISSYVLDGLYQLKAGCTAGLASGMSVFLALERQVTARIKASVQVSFMISTGLTTVRLRCERLGQRISLPIILGRRISPRIILGTLVLPVLSTLSYHYLFDRPRRRRRYQAKLQDLMVEHQDTLDRRRQQASEIQEVMRESALQRIAEESRKNGTSGYWQEGLTRHESSYRLDHHLSSLWFRFTHYRCHHSIADSCQLLRIANHTVKVKIKFARLLRPCLGRGQDAEGHLYIQK